MLESVLPMFPSRNFIVSGLMFISLIHFEFIFVYGVRKCSRFILLQVVDHFSQDHSAFSKTSLNIWKFTVHVLLKPGLENFEHYFTSVCHECSCAAV